jgi:hypothetical protein
VSRGRATKGGKLRQGVCRNLSHPLPNFCRHLPPFVTGNCRNLSPFAAVRGAVSSHFNLHLLATTVFADDLFCPLMTETAQRKRGGKAFHRIL